MKKGIKIGSIVLGLTICVLISIKGLETNKVMAATGASQEKVLICHKPPGNPGNGQDIWVSPNAVAAHMSHGDMMGSCTATLSCQELCEQQYNNCVASAGGDPNLLKYCESQRKSCLGECGPAAPPAEPK